MTMKSIIAGSLAKPPVEKTSAKGNSYLLATIAEKNGDKTRWITCFVFGDVELGQFRLMQVGEPVCVSGEINAEIYTPAGGEPRVSWSIVVDGVLTARQKPKDKSPGREIAHKSWAAPKKEDFSDAIPF